MKRNLTLVFLCMLLLVSLAGCRDANQFKETTLTFVNESSYDVEEFGFTYEWLQFDKRVISETEEVEVIASGESIVVGIPPVLAEEIPLLVELGVRIGEYVERFGIELTYAEGSDIKMTLINQHEENNYIVVEGSEYEVIDQK